jgi:hypothetical protein
VKRLGSMSVIRGGKRRVTSFTGNDFWMPWWWRTAKRSYGSLERLPRKIKVMLQCLLALPVGHGRRYPGGELEDAYTIAGVLAPLVVQ